MSSASDLRPIPVLVKRLDDCWVRYKTELKRTQSEFADEYVHDLRVSIRRLSAAFKMGRAVVHGGRLKKSRRLLKAQTDAFDELRDTQVQLSIAVELQEDLPEIEPYRRWLRKREKRLISRLERDVRDFRAGGLGQQVTRLRKALLARDAAEDGAAVWAAVDEAYAVVLRRKLAVQSENTDTIHRLRLAFKKFRYMVESIQVLLVGLPPDYLRRLHDTQAAMGEIQDLEVGLQMLVVFAEKSGEELPAVARSLDEMHGRRVQAFLGSMHQIDNFWRPAPNKKFPWQKTKRTQPRKARKLP